MAHFRIVFLHKVNTVETLFSIRSWGLAATDWRIHPLSIYVAGDEYIDKIGNENIRKKIGVEFRVIITLKN